MALPKYSKIRASLDHDDHGNLLPEDAHNEQDSESGTCQDNFRDATQPWKMISLGLTILLCLSLSSNLFLPRYCPKSSKMTYETGFKTDLSAVRDEIELVEYAFTNGVELGEDGNYTSAGSKYVGEPSPEIDREWHALLKGLNMDVHSYEAEGIEDKTYNWEDTDLYFTGLGVFHSLHCLYRLRQAFYPDYYQNVFDTSARPWDPPRGMHIDHCIDYLRQALQCSADLTPMYWSRIDDRLLLKASGEVHTCRNFNKIHEWAAERKTLRAEHIGGEELKIVD